MTTTKKQQAINERDKAIGYLRDALKPGDTVYTILRHVSSSGMSRVIDLLIPTDKGIRRIGYLAADVLDYKFDTDKSGLKVSGCGMDMGAHVVYSLGRVLFPDGFKVEGYGRNGDTSGWDKDGGYALRHEWL